MTAEFDLQEVRFEMRGRTFVAREMMAADAVTLWSGEADTSDTTEIQFRLIKASVTMDGQPILEPAKLPAQIYLKLSRIVMDLNGLTAEDEEGAPGNA